VGIRTIFVRNSTLSPAEGDGNRTEGDVRLTQGPAVVNR
jgi:hypothetical protein